VANSVGDIHARCNCLSNTSFSSSR